MEFGEMIRLAIETAQRNEQEGLQGFQQLGDFAIQKRQEKLDDKKTKEEEMRKAEQEKANTAQQEQERQDTLAREKAERDFQAKQEALRRRHDTEMKKREMKHEQEKLKPFAARMTDAYEP